MTLLVTELDGLIRKRIGGKPSLSLLRIVNSSGDYLTMAHEWEWTRRSKTLSIPAGAESIPLPPDFAQFWSTNPVDAIGGYYPTTIDDLDRRRAGTRLTGSGAATWGALSYRSGPSGITPMLELWPPSGSLRTNFLRLRYRARWADVRSESQPVPLPPWPALEMVFVDICCAYAQGHSEADVAGRAARLAEIISSPDFAAAVLLDSGAQDTAGPILGGAAQALLSPSPPAQDFTFGGIVTR